MGTTHLCGGVYPRIDQVDGVHAQCPYISNAYHTMPDSLASLVENDGYFVRNDMLAVLAAAYDGPDSKGFIDSL